MTRERRRFLYLEVAQALRRRIERGVYAPGTRIPTEAELVREFGVSAITVRRALRDLTTQGCLFGRQGLGVFVTDARRIVRRVGAELRASMADDMRRAGIEPGMKERALTVGPADEETARRLGLRTGTLVYRHEKLLLADGEPLGLDVTVLPRRLGDALREHLSSDFVLAVLRAHGVAVHHTDYEFQAGVVSSADAAVLGLPAGFPLLVVRYTVVGPDGAPVITGRTVSRADRFTYQFCGHPELHEGRARP